MFDFKLKGNWRGAMKLVDDYGERSTKLQLVATHRIAEIFLDKLLSFIPNEMDGYKDSLKIVMLKGIKGGVCFAIVSEADEISGGDLPVDTTAVYIVNKSFDSKLLRILEAFSPWTMDRLPLGFDENETDVIYREVTKGEVLRLRSENDQVLRDIHDQLMRYGAERGSSKKISNIKALPDLAFKAMRMELGLGVKRIPHWSKALKGLASWVKNDFKKEGLFYKYLADENFNKYKSGESFNEMDCSKFEKENSSFEEKIKGF